MSANAGELIVPIPETADRVDLIIASVPDHYRGNQTYGYQYFIGAGSPTGEGADFNGDGRLTGTDIDALSAQVGTSDLTFDLNGDGSVTVADREAWFDLAGAIVGDTDFDNSVDFADFLALSESFGQLGGWANGDFDGSGDVAFPDFLLLSTNFGIERANASPTPVPEPNCGLILLFGVAGMGLFRDRRCAA